MKRQKQYREQVFENNNRDDDNRYNVASIIKQEIYKTIKRIKSGKSIGPDEIPIETLKITLENRLYLTEDLFNNIHNTGEIPNKSLLSAFVPITKKINTRTCEEYKPLEQHS